MTDTHDNRTTIRAARDELLYDVTRLLSENGWEVKDAPDGEPFVATDPRSHTFAFGALKLNVWIEVEEVEDAAE